MVQIKLVIVQNEQRFEDDIFILLGIIESRAWQS